MKKSKRLIALALVLSLFVFDLGINNFIALAAYADDNVSSETEELAGSTQETLASSIAEDEEENETAAEKPVEEENLSNEEVSFEAETLAAQEPSKGSETADAAIPAEENAETADTTDLTEKSGETANTAIPAEESGETADTTDPTGEELPDTVDYIFSAQTVSLSEILKELGIELAEKNYKLRVDSKDVSLSAKKIKDAKTEQITLTALKSFDRATLTITGSDEENSYTIVLSCRLDNKQSEEEEAAVEAEKDYTADENTEDAAAQSETDETAQLADIEQTAADFVFSQKVVKLSEILDTLGISAENNSTLRLDSALVELSETTLKNKNRDAITLTALDYFDCAVLTIEKKNARQTITLAYPKPVDSQQDPDPEEQQEEERLVDYRPADAIWANEELYLTGKMPGNAVVEATPVTVEIDGVYVLAAYDIKIYANARQQEKGKTWQPAGEKVQVHFYNDAFSAAAVDVYHLEDADSEAEFVGEVSAEDGWVTFDAAHFSIYAVSVLEKQIEASDGNTYQIRVSYDASSMLPADAELHVSEIGADAEGYNDYVNQSTDAVGLDQADLSMVHVFDIAIVDPVSGAHLQPQAAVQVEIRLLSDSIDDGEQLSLLHFGDELEEMEASAAGSTVSFSARGFSVYVLVQGPQKPYEPSGLYLASSLDEIEEQGADGFYLNFNGYYLTGGVVHNVTNNADRDGLTATSATYSTHPPEAVKFYFTRVSASEFTIYTMSGESRNYVKMSKVSDYAARAGLSLTADESEATPFTIEKIGSGKTFYFSAKLSGTTYYWNRNTKTPGFGAIAGYNGKSDQNTGKIALEYDIPAQFDPYELDGKSFSLMNYSSGTTGVGLTDAEVVKNESSRLGAKQLLVRSDPMDQSRTLFTSKDAQLAVWTFECIEEDRYYLSCGGKYLCIDGTNVTLSESANENCVIRPIPGEGGRNGKIRLLAVAANRALSYSGNVNDGFTQAAIADNNNQWFNFVQPSVYGDEDFVEYYAYKVSASDKINVTNGKQIILYMRVWNTKEEKYNFYAIDHNGDLVPCYESGDTIVWIGTRNNTLLWNFTEYYQPGTTQSNGYYELQNGYTGRYIAPQISNGQIFSDSTIGLNLNGRQYGDYYTTVLAWDDSHYDYAGLKTENGKVVSCPVAQAETIYFAVINLADHPLTPVETVDHTALGLTMKMVDFDGNSWQNTVLGSSAGGMGTTLQQGLLATNIEGSASGYPKTQTGASLGDLYAGASTVNHLFIQSVYDGSGYYQFDSSENFAHLNGGEFEVYQELGAAKNPGNTHSHGQFMPYNSLDTSKPHPDNPENLTDIYGHQLSDTYPRKYETLYGYNEAENSYFGMELEGHFAQPANGRDAWGHDIIFEFVGDDDFWLYVDGELIIDLGGIHSAVGASVNYSTGKVVVNGNHTTLYDLFKSNYETRNPSVGANEVNTYLDSIFTTKTVTVNGKEETQHIFKDYSPHTVRIFYMERGAGASNLRMRFNLASVTPGQVLLSKEIAGTDKQDFASVKFPFQIFYDEGNGAGYQLLDQVMSSINNQWQVVYYNSSTKVDFARSVTIDGVSYENVFYLKPGQTAAIKIPDNSITYYIRECGVDTSIYDEVKINGETPVEIVPAGASNTKCFETTEDSVSNRVRVNFSNHVNPSALRTLTITKRLFDAAGTELTAAQDNAAFTVRIYLGEEGEYYKLGDYYIKAPDGSYCYFDSAAGGFASTGVSNFDLLTAEQLQKVTFKTSPSGAASKLPAQYSIEIRDLLVGTSFKVVEEDYDIPLGYGKRSWSENEGGIQTSYYAYKRVAGSYLVAAGDTQNAGVIRDNSNPHIEIHNQAGWGIRANKVWTDADFMRRHDDTYFAVYVSGSLLPGSVRRIDSYNYTTYFFPALESGSSFADYRVFEVKLSDPAVASDGSVSYSAIERIEENGALTLGGIDKDGTIRSELHYAASYKQGSGSKTRVDTITNTRIGGLRIIKTDWNGTPLAGAAFELTRGTELLGSFRSDADGLVTTAYLEDGSYTLTETRAPKQYQAENSVFTITASAGSFTVTGSGESFSYDAATQTLYVKNKPFTLKALVVDAADNSALADVHYALYRQIEASNGELIRDYYPVSGFEDLVSDANGILSGIDQTLESGSYYLSVKRLPAGYELSTPVKETLFTIGTDGIVSIAVGASYTGSLSESGDERTDYTITIPLSKENAPIAPTGYQSNTESLVWLFMLSAILLGAGVLFRVMRRRDEEN